MRIACGVIGILLLLLVLTDIAWTTFLEGGGPLTRRVCGYTGRVALALRWRCGSRRVLTLTGLAAVVLLTGLWVAGIWAAWGLIFNATSQSIINSNTGLPASIFHRFYFAGGAIFTLGAGGYQPVGRLWEIAADFAAGSGFLFFGLTVCSCIDASGGGAGASGRP